MFKKVLVANRGEVALRVVRALKELGITSVAIYSQADADSLHVLMADEAYCVGPAPNAKSYLNIPSIISVALTSGCDAIHPGYGFLSERADFVDVCDAHGIKFIGPTAEQMRAMGDKAQARKTMIDAKVPVTPGTDLVETEDDAIAFAKKTGYPLIVKATAGGGGKGMRVANNDNELKDALTLCKTEALNAFGNDGVYIEKFIQNPKHVEVQIIADTHGNVCHLGERDCSVQRRHQKLIEETPCVALSDKIRKDICDAAVRAAKAINYEGAGTIEFLLDKDNNWYFMEMNTRLQVEHGISEMYAGIDLVKAQIRVAQGLPLGFKQDDIRFSGHVIECRINAEDADKNFMPCPGEISGYIAPGGYGVRVDSHVYTGYKIPPYYDSLVGKLMCIGKDRTDAIATMKRALGEYVITNVKTTIPYHIKVLNDKIFQSGKFDTSFLETFNQDQ